MRLMLSWTIYFGLLAAMMQTPLSDPLDLTNVVSADIQRKDVDNNTRVVIVINLTGGMKYTTDFFLNEDADKFKNGTNPEKNALRKKYIRQAIRNYRSSLAAQSAETDRGVATIPKSQFSDPGDTNP